MAWWKSNVHVSVCDTLFTLRLREHHQRHRMNECDPTGRKNIIMISHALAISRNLDEHDGRHLHVVFLPSSARHSLADFQTTDPDEHHVRLHIVVGLCHIILFIFPQNIYHPAPSRQKCEKTYNEQCYLQASFQAGLVSGQHRGPQQSATWRRLATRGPQWRANVHHVKRAQFR